MLDFNENSVRNDAVVSLYRSKAALAPCCPSKRGMIHPWDPSQATAPTGLSGANIWVAEDWLCPLSSLTLFHPLCLSLSLPFPVTAVCPRCPCCSAHPGCENHLNSCQEGLWALRVGLTPAESGEHTRYLPNPPGLQPGGSILLILR